MDLAAAERADLADLLDTLTAEQWESLSLCEGWTVRTVVAHVVSYEELGTVGGWWRFLRCGMSFDRANAVSLRAYTDRTPDELCALLRRHLRPSGLTAINKGAVGLTDGMIHHQDIRRPLGLHRRIPEERLVPALHSAVRAPALPSRKLVRGLRLEATDVGWTHGDGPLARGAGEALLLTIAGRPAAARDLDGEGARLVCARLDAEIP